MKYYSEKLDQLFETKELLEEAEKKHDAEEAKKEEARLVVKKESAEVTEAFKTRNAARRAYNEQIVKARKAYSEALRAAKEAFEADIKEASDSLEKAEEDFDTKLSAFQKAHPEGYHLTLKDGDNVVTFTSVGDLVKSINAEFDNVFTEFDNIFRRLY